jgi:hypothetical protein
VASIAWCAHAGDFCVGLVRIGSRAAADNAAWGRQAPSSPWARMVMGHEWLECPVSIPISRAFHRHHLFVKSQCRMWEE